jgi:hypothetical protein
MFTELSIFTRFSPAAAASVPFGEIHLVPTFSSSLLTGTVAADCIDGLTADPSAAQTKKRTIAKTC